MANNSKSGSSSSAKASTKQPAKSGTDGVATDEGPLSTDDLDKIIEQEDSGFFSALKEIDKDDLNSQEELETVVDVSQVSSELNPEAQEDSEQQVAPKAEESKKISIPKKILKFLLRTVMRVLDFVADSALRIGVTVVSWLKKGPKVIIADVVKFLKIIFSFLDHLAQTVLERTWKEKVVFVVVVGLSVVLFLAVKKIMHNESFLPKASDELLANFADVADHEYKYDPYKGKEGFFESLRYSENIMLLDKMEVNIRPSAHSGRNPMIFLEVFVVGFSNDAVIEMKDRQIEMQDLAQRVIEGFSYDQLVGAEGKPALKGALIKEFNQVLTTGRIKDVLIKTMVLKP